MNRYRTGAAGLAVGLGAAALAGLVSLRGGLWLWPRHPIVGGILVVSGGLGVLSGALVAASALAATPEATP